MEIAIPDKEDLERNLELLMKARRRATLKNWLALADFHYDMTFEQDEPVEDGEEDFGRSLLHALVELSWRAWKRDADTYLAGLRAGQDGIEESGVPPFLNMRMGLAHIELSIFFDQAGELSLSDDAQALGMLLLTFHVSEAFVRPAMVMATFILDILAGKEASIEKVLRSKNGRGRIRSYDDVRSRLEESIEAARKELGSRKCLNVLDRLLNPSDDEETDQSRLDLSLRAVRNAVAHHDFDIFEGEVRLRWVWHARGGQPGRKDVLPLEELDDNLRTLRGLVMTFFAWENTMLGVHHPEEIPEDADPSILAAEFVEVLERLKKVAWPFIR